MIKVSMEGEEPKIAVTVPLFLKKLWKMVNDKDAEDIIGWNSTGDGFVIYDQLQFIMKLLPQYFRHNNMASFIRQLNFYDFHKVAGIDKDEIHFTHNYFLKDLPETLVFIRRKCTSVKSKTANNVKEEELTDLLNGVKEIKTKHSIVDTEIKLLKQENAALWSEINNLRVKHSKQTKIINKIIHFLISYMHSHQTSLSKRSGVVSRKNNQNNLKTGPTILEIDYHNSDLPKQTRQNSYTVTEPSQKDNMLYDTGTENISSVQPVIDSSLEEMLKTVPVVNQQRISSSKNLERDNSLGKLKAHLNPTKPDMLGNSLPNIRNNPKENVSSVENPKSDMLENIINTLSNTNEGIIDNTCIGNSLNPNTQGNLTMNMLNDPQKDLGLYTSDIQKMPVPFKNSQNCNIRENPKESLGNYLDRTHTELINLQDLLNNLSSSELSDLFDSIENVGANDSKESIPGADLENLSEVINNQNVDSRLGGTYKDTTDRPLSIDYDVLPVGSSYQDVTTGQNRESESYKFTPENIAPPESLVDEYFNTDF